MACWVAGVLACGFTWVLGDRGAGKLACWDVGMARRRHAGMQGCLDAGLPECWLASCVGAGMLACRVPGVLSCMGV